MRNSTYFLAGMSIVLVAGGFTFAGEAKLPLNFVLDPVLTGLERPSAMVLAGTGRIYVAERYTGDVHLIRNGKLLPDPVVTVSVPPVADPETDEGLLDIAFDPAGPSDGYLYLFYTESGTGDNKVVRYTLLGDSAGYPWVVKNLGPSLNHDRIGGSLVVGNDGLLYIGVGDMGSSGEAQNDESDLGKVLQLTGTVTVPYAKGFRNGVGLATHPDVATLYLTDRGPDGEYDELNAVASDNNHGWPTYIGPFGGAYDTLPIHWHQPPVGTRGPASYSGTHFPDEDSDGTDSVFYACSDSNEIVRSVLTGPDLDAQDSAHTFFDPAIEVDGTPDTDCPPTWVDLAEGGDGMLYALADDTDGVPDRSGIYRFVYDRPGPREVSPPGSALPLTLEKSGADLVLYWEDVDRDAWVGTVLGASQPVEAYTIWEGDLPISGGAYSHAVKMTTDGTPVNDGLLSQQVTPGSASTYYLVSHQGANLEGSLGTATGVGERPGKPVQDYCDEIGWFDNEYGDAQRETDCNGIDDDGDGEIDESCAGNIDYAPRPGRCGPDFVDGGGAPVRLLDQFGNYLTLHDFRGQSLHMDISAINCGHCMIQFPAYAGFYDEYRGRGFTTISVLVQSYSTMAAIPPANCAAEIQNWIDSHAPGADHPVLCAVNDGGDGTADIYEQYGGFFSWDGIMWNRCNGTPMNLFFDQGMVMYHAVCGRYLAYCDGGNCSPGQPDPCLTDAECGPNKTCVYPSCIGDADCVGTGGTQTCVHAKAREIVDAKLRPERCE